MAFEIEFAQLSKRDTGHWRMGRGDEFPPADFPVPGGSLFTRLDTGKLYKWSGSAWVEVGGSSASLTIQEVDGVPSVTSADTLMFDQADGFVLTDLGSGDARVDLSGIPEARVASLVTDLDALRYLALGWMS